jgi:hypothetical protein
MLVREADGENGRPYLTVGPSGVLKRFGIFGLTTEISKVGQAVSPAIPMVAHLKLTNSRKRLSPDHLSFTFNYVTLVIFSSGVVRCWSATRFVFFSSSG